MFLHIMAIYMLHHMNQSIIVYCCIACTVLNARGAALREVIKHTTATLYVLHILKVGHMCIAR